MGGMLDRVGGGGGWGAVVGPPSPSTPNPKPKFLCSRGPFTRNFKPETQTLQTWALTSKPETLKRTAATCCALAAVAVVHCPACALMGGPGRGKVGCAKDL